MMLAPALVLGITQFYGVTAISSLNVDTSSGPVQGFMDDITPHPKSKENAIIKATGTGPACPQFEGNAPNIWLTDAPEFIILPRDYQGEDCLNVNVWAPWNECEDEGDEAEFLPVIVWIYGGSFLTGGPTVPYQIPARWVERTGKYFVVGINYRVNIFGFPNAKALADDQQNLGLLDQRLALEWGRDNIANFNGDPKRITLWGQSAGAVSVDEFNFAYPEDPIVQGLIMNSSADTGTEINCLRGVDSANIIRFLNAYADNGTTPALTFNQITDNRTKFANYTACALAGKFTRMPAIIGSATKGGVAFLSYNQTYGPDQTDANALTASLILCPVVKTTQDRYAANATTFRYLYGGNFSNIAPRPWEVAFHSSDLPLIFGIYGIVRSNDYYLAFAKDPVNGLPELGWDAYETNGEAVFLGYEGKVLQSIKESVLESPCNGSTPNGLSLPW
ncbi:alpha/beta-hydrolase [Clathrospora elynae]|uniref:Alpha/beta-hydrolase n=1 Tax=Clathrospora elynae TaxID=706981 RepID=A0A6A5SK84_9PLEO|nr:alpha/beta-hydrolase [Clathrospora elynae]